MARFRRVYELPIILFFCLSSFDGLVTPTHGQLVEKRQNFYGGYALITDSCPDETDPCGDRSCCPKGTTCATAGGWTAACCPGENDCHDAVEQLPACADAAWSLWNTTGFAGSTKDPICCLPGFKGVHPENRDVLGSCVPEGATVPENEQADLIASGTGVPGAAATSASDEGSTAAATTTSSGQRSSSTSGSSRDDSSSSSSSSSSDESNADNASSDASNDDSGDDGSSSLGAGAIGGIVGGVVGGLVIIALVAFYCIRRNRREFDAKLAAVAGAASGHAAHPPPVGYAGMQAPTTTPPKQAVAFDKEYVPQDVAEADGRQGGSRFELAGAR